MNTEQELKMNYPSFELAIDQDLKIEDLKNIKVSRFQYVILDNRELIKGIDKIQEFLSNSYRLSFGNCEFSIKRINSLLNEVKVECEDILLHPEV